MFQWWEKYSRCGNDLTLRQLLRDKNEYGELEYDFFHDSKYEKSAKRYCSHCPVLFYCREYALKHEELIGLWGGLTYLERRRIRRRGDFPPSPRPHRARYPDTDNPSVLAMAYHNAHEDLFSEDLY